MEKGKIKTKSLCGPPGFPNTTPSPTLRGRRKKGRGRGEGEREKGSESPPPLPNPPPLLPFLPIPYPLPLSTPATQATLPQSRSTAQKHSNPYLLFILLVFSLNAVTYNYSDMTLRLRFGMLINCAHQAKC